MRNVRIAYVLTFIKHSWFWLGIWVFYYLRFTDYAGLGLIESIVITILSISEIPTGAVADLLGKRKTLALSFLIEGIGSVIMAFAPNFNILLISLPFIAIGSALYSGTLEAMVYDSLKEVRQEKIYDKVISKISTIQLLTFALSTIVGGWLYLLWPGLPYLLVGIFYLIGVGVSLLVVEPTVDTEKFSWSNYVAQSKQGFAQLFSKSDRWTSLLLIGIAAVIYMVYQVVNDILGVEFGFSPWQWSMVTMVVFFVSALGSLMTPKLIRWVGKKYSYIIATCIVGLTLIISPWLTLMIGGLSVLIRFIFTTITNNIASVWINENTDSRYRATTLSTYNLLTNLPYAITAYFLGAIMQLWSGKWFAFALGVILLVILLPMLRRDRRRPSNQASNRITNPVTIAPINITPR